LFAYPRNLKSLVLIPLIALISFPAMGAQLITKPLASGVTLTQIISDSDGIPSMVVNVVRVDPKTPGLRIEAVLGQDRVFGLDPTKGRETVSSIANRLHAAAVINGDYFWLNGDPLGLMIANGELVSEPRPHRVAFGITSDGKFLFDQLDFDASITLRNGKSFPIKGIDRERGKNELIAYTPKFFSSTCTITGGSEVVIDCGGKPVRVDVPITGQVMEVRPALCDTAIQEGCLVLSGSGPAAKFIEENLTPDMKVTLRFNLKPLQSAGWNRVQQAVSGGPWLVRDGKIFVDGKEEGFQNDVLIGTNPRTALGVTADNKLVLVTVDGRQNISGGVSLLDLAGMMKSEGCVEAMNLDGGVSTTLATYSGVLNSPADGEERPIADGLAVISDAYAPVSGGRIEDSGFRIQGPESVIQSGKGIQLSLINSAGHRLDAAEASKAVWTVAGGVGFVEQTGQFFGIKARNGRIAVRLGDKTASIPVTVVPGPPKTLTAKLTPDKDATNRAVLTAIVTDLNRNPIKDVPVSVRIIGGTADREHENTNSSGSISIGITLDEGQAGGNYSAEVSCGTMKTTIEARSIGG